MTSPFDKMVGPSWQSASKRRTQKKRRARFKRVMARQLKRHLGAHNRHAGELSINAAFAAMEPGQYLRVYGS